MSRRHPLKTKKKNRSIAHRLRIDELENRVVPSISVGYDVNNLVTFTGDSAADSLLLRRNASGQLEYSANGAAFTNDLKTTTPGIQALTLSSISKIVTQLGDASDVLTLDFSNGSVMPASGISFNGGAGADRVVVVLDTNFTLTNSSLVLAPGGTVALNGVEQADLTGGTSPNLIDASGFTAGPVTLHGGSQTDTLIGGAGNDSIVGDQGSDVIIGGAGDDTLDSTNSGNASLLGGSGNDVLLGGNGKDSLAGGEGNDTLRGGNGADLLDGGAGDDDLEGEGGNDEMKGGLGTDTAVATGDVSFTLTDSLLTGLGTDTLTDIERARLTGGATNKIIDASAFHGATTLQGGGGNDQLIGGFGSNLFVKPVGEIGNVTMIGGPAGSTNEYRLWAQGATSLISGGGFNQVSFTISALAITFDLNITDGTPQIVDANGSTVALTGNFGELQGSEFDDYVTAASNTTVMGGGGKDTLVADGKNNINLNGGADADSLLQTGGEAIVMNGDTGIDSLTSTGGTSITMNGGSDADSLTSTSGSGITMNGGSDADSLISSSGTGIVMNGDTGIDSLTSTGGTSITMNGGSDADSLTSTSGIGIVMNGDTGIDSLTSTTGSGITMNGGSDADSLQQINGEFIVMNGDTGIDSLTSTGGTSITMNGGSDADSLTSSSGSSITMNGGLDADSLLQTAGTTIVMNGDTGVDSLTSSGGTLITMNGGSDADSLQQIGGEIIVMNGDTGIDSLTSEGGTSITMNGGSDADSLTSTSGTGIVMNGDTGIDSLTSSGGTSITMNGGSDADSLLQTAGTTIVMNGDDGLDALSSTDGQTITMNGGADSDSLVSTGGTSIIISGDTGADTLVSSGATTINMSGGADADTLVLADPTPTTQNDSKVVSGGAGDDTFVFVGSSSGPMTINESAADAGVDTLDFSSFTGGPITLDLASVAAQSQSPGGLVVRLTDGQAIENVVGTSGADTISGNELANQLLGADLQSAAIGPAPAWDGITQQVYLDFESQTGEGEHVYTAAERSAIVARLEADYLGPNPASPWFHVQFSQTPPASGPYATLLFNHLPPDLPNNQTTGGYSDDLDFRNTNLGGTAYIQVNGMLGGLNQPPDTTDNRIALSEKIAAHELGHLLGLLHQDSFGPIGFGIHLPPGPRQYLPAYAGPAAAFETFNHIMGSPASVGSTRFNDVGDLFFGEREAIKLAFSESGTVVNEQSGYHGTRASAQAINLVPLATPNTLSRGLNFSKQFGVKALDVTGSIVLNGLTSENDYYSFTGQKGDVLTFEVLSKGLTRLAGNTIDPILRIRDSSGIIIAFYSGSAVNDDRFEPTDSSLIDLRLPENGTYFIEVDTFSAASTPDTDVGAYELLVYQFDAWNGNDVGDLLQGRGGDDSLVGGLGTDILNGAAGNDLLDGGDSNDTYLGLMVGNDSLKDGGGRDTLDFSAATTGVNLNLSLNAGQVQTISSAGNMLSVLGLYEIVVGTSMPDFITGNAADNTFFGGAGSDTLLGGLGNDILQGGDGNDDLQGGDGRDFLVGGFGADVLAGNGGDDILLGNITTYDANQIALDSIMAEWTGSNSYALRIAHLTGTTGGANGSVFLLRGSTVLDDNKVKDTLFGGLGMDLFLTLSGDSVGDKENGETVL